MRECTCSPGAIERYRRRLSGPLLDRIDLQVYVQPGPARASCAAPSPASRPRAIRARVVAARDRQRRAARAVGPALQRRDADRRSCARPASSTPSASARSPSLVERRRAFTARSIDRLIKVARTIADLIGQDDIDAGCLLEAAAFRAIDPSIGVLAA